MAYHKAIQAHARALYSLKYRSVRKTADALQIPKSSVHRWVRGSPLEARRERAATKLDRIVTDITHALVANPHHNARTLWEALRARGHAISLRTVARAIQRTGWTRKRAFAFSNRSADQEERERAFFSSMDLTGDYISVDETCIYESALPIYGYSPKGTRLRRQQGRGQRVKYTLMMAIGREGVVHHSFFRGNGNTTNFSDFLRSIPGGSQVLLDNVAFHRAAAVRETAREREINLVFLPPYRPDLNPIEHAFSVVKHHFRQRFDVQDTEQRMSIVLAELTANKLAAMYRAVASRVPE